jgi:hypothetical protein
MTEGHAMAGVTYLPTDLQRRYRVILDEAKAGEARVRDLDGTNILLLPEADVLVLRRVCEAAANLATIERVVEVMASRRPELPEYGEWSWVRVFDVDDLREFMRDIREAIIVGVREGTSKLLDEQLRAWRVTAQQADDPLFRAVLAGGAAEEDFVEVRRPRARQPAARGHAPARGAVGAE